MRRTKNRRVTVNVQKEKSSVGRFIIWGLIFGLFVATYQVGIKFAEPRLLPIKHINLEAHCERTSQDEIKKKTALYVKGFFSTDVMKLKEKLLSIPFIDEVSIKRIWPDTLLVTLVEQQFVAAWGEGCAVSSKGNVIAGIAIRKNLPKFNGPDGQASVMLDQYYEMSKILQPLNLTIKELNLNSRRSWQMVLSNNMKIVMGRKDMGNKLLGLTGVFPKLKKRHGDSIESVDLRYPNGVCVHVK